MEWAWLTGRHQRAAEIGDVLLPHLEPPGAAVLRGELLRYLARAGLAHGQGLDHHRMSGHARGSAVNGS